MSTRSAFAAVSVGLLCLAGCGERPGYDSTPVESYLARSQAGSFGPAVRIGRATCPEDLALEEGMTFRCRLDVADTALPYRVRLSQVRSEEMRVSAAPDGVLMSGEKVRDFVRSTLPKGSSAADVDCGGVYFVAEVGQTLECTLALGAQQRSIEVRVKDEAGVVTLGS
jgi:hypothetical protein